MKIYKIVNSNGDFIVGKSAKKNTTDYIKQYVNSNDCFNQITKDKKYKLEIDEKDYERSEVRNAMRDLLNDEKCINEEKGGKYSIIKKEYTINNNERKDYHKNYYEENSVEILNAIKVKVYCECCDVSITKSNFTKHLKSHKHSINSIKN